MTTPEPVWMRGDGRGWGCRIALALAFGLLAMFVTALAAAMFDWSPWAPAFVGLAVCGGVGLGPFLQRAARTLLGSRTPAVVATVGDAALAGLAACAVLLGAWLAGRVDTVCVRDARGAEAHCAIREYRWFGRSLAADRLVPGVRGAAAEGSEPGGLRNAVPFGRDRNADYALVLDTATGRVLVTAATRPSAEAAAAALSPVLERPEPGAATATIIDWIAPLFAIVPGSAIAFLALRRGLRRLRPRRTRAGSSPRM